MSKTAVCVSRGLAVKVFEGLNIPTAANWEKPKMQSKLDQIHLLVTGDVKIGDDYLDNVLNQLIAAKEDGDEIELLSDKAYAEKYPNGNPAFGEQGLDTAKEEADDAPEEAPEAEETAEKEAEEAPAEVPVKAEKAKKTPKKNKEKAEKEPKEPKPPKIRGTESYHAGVALKDTKAVEAEGEGDDAKGGKITEATWNRFYEIHGDSGKKTRKGFMGAARQAIRAFKGLSAERKVPSKAYVCGAALREDPKASHTELSAKLEGSTSENDVIAKKAIQAVCGYGLLELEEEG